MKTVFLSHPMAGKTDKGIFQIRHEMKNYIEDYLGEEVEIISSYMDLGDVHSLIYIGKCLELMSLADIVLVHPDWKISRGCRIEVDAAILYKIPHVIFMK